MEHTPPAASSEIPRVPVQLADQAAFALAGRSGGVPVVAVRLVQAISLGLIGLR